MVRNVQNNSVTIRTLHTSLDTTKSRKGRYLYVRGVMLSPLILGRPVAPTVSSKPMKTMGGLAPEGQTLLVFFLQHQQQQLLKLSWHACSSRAQPAHVAHCCNSGQHRQQLPAEILASVPGQSAAVKVS
jgi:hypothetical protein